MGLLDALFGKQKEQTINTMESSEITGQTHNFENIEVLILDHVVHDDRHPFPEKKKQLYFAAFAKEPFVFDGEVRSILVTNAYVKRDLSGSLNAYLYSQSADEVLREHSDFGEYPKPTGDLYLHLIDGTLRCVKVSKWPGGKAWTNDSYKEHYGRK